MSATLIHNLRQIATPLGVTGIRGRGMRELRTIDGGVLVVREGRFEFVGPESDMPRSLRAEITSDIDGNGCTALPGFVDAHTHVPFAGFRESEFNRRLQGETYEQIAASGGG